MSNRSNNKKGANYLWWRLFALAGFIGLILILYKAGLFHFFMDRDRVKTFLDSLGPLSFVGFMVLQTIQVVAAPVPGEVTGFIGGFLYGKTLGLFLSTIGLTLGSWVAFSLGRIFGRPFIDRIVSQETLDKYSYLLHHKGAFLVFLLFLIPGMPKDLLCYILGLGHLSTRAFLIISTTGRFGGTVLLTLGGSYIRNQQYYRFFVLLGITIVIIFFVMVYKDRMERLFRILHIQSRLSERRKRKALRKALTSEEGKKPR